MLLLASSVVEDFCGDFPCPGSLFKRNIITTVAQSPVGLSAIPFISRALVNGVFVLLKVSLPISPAFASFLFLAAQLADVDIS